MTDVKRTFMVNTPRDEVVRYLRDFARAEQWDPGTVSCTQIGDGPVRLGTKWRNVSEFRGRETELEYELVCDEPGRLTFTGRNKTVTSTDDLVFADSGANTVVAYHAHFRWHGLIKLVAPFVKGAIEDLGDPTVAQLKATLETLP
ncbi:MAG: SRPBCC family protein [Rhodococcus fascians]